MPTAYRPTIDVERVQLVLSPAGQAQVFDKDLPRVAVAKALRRVPRLAAIDAAGIVDGLPIALGLVRLPGGMEPIHGIHHQAYA